MAEFIKTTPRVPRRDLGDGVGAAIAEKGGISVYLGAKFPVTLYREQLQRLLEKGEAIMDFANEHAEFLAEKPVKAAKGEPDGIKLPSSTLAFVTARAAAAMAEGDVVSAVRYATIKGIADANSGRVSKADAIWAMNQEAGQ